MNSIRSMMRICFRAGERLSAIILVVLLAMPSPGAAISFEGSEPPTPKASGLSSFSWETTNSPTVMLKAVTADGPTAFEHPVRLTDLKSGGSSGEHDIIPCVEPRPQICTRDYRPACARLAEGGYKTYPNGCTACSDTAVDSYREGECE